MHHLAFFESQADRHNDRKQELLVQSCKAFMSASSKTNGLEVNGVADCEMPQEKAITEDMPRWKQEQLKKQNEKIRKEIEERNERKKREEEELKQKWDGVPAWKATIIKKREEIKKLEEERILAAQRKEEEEKARWENLPVWKRDIYQKKGLKPVNRSPDRINPADTDSQVTRDKSTPDINITSEDIIEHDENAPKDDELNSKELTDDDKTDPNGDQQELQDNVKKDGDGYSNLESVSAEGEQDANAASATVEEAPKENGEVSSKEPTDDEKCGQEINKCGQEINELGQETQRIEQLSE